MTILPSICMVVALCGADPVLAAENRFMTESQKHMGTTFTIQIAGAGERDTGPAMVAAFAKIGELDRMMTDYDPASELSRLGATAPHSQPVKVSPDLGRILQAALAASEASDGAFDVTVGPITRLWRQARRQKKLTERDKLQGALAAVGYKRLLVKQTASGEWTVQLTTAGMRLDLGGIAQGYAADAALEVLKAHGFASAMVNASGDIVVGDAPPGERGWKIGLAALDPKQAPTRFVILANAAISSSGDAFQYVEVEGKRYSHIVDPKTGLGLTTPMAVTVIATSATTADAYASAACVLGPGRTDAKLLERASVRGVLFIEQGSSGVETTEIGDFARHLAE